MSGRTIHEVPLVSEVKGGMKIPISDGGNLPQTASVEQINKFISDQIRIYVNDLLKRYVEKIDGKGLSTNDFTNTLKSKLDSLSNYDDTQIVSNIAKLQNVLDTLVSGDISSKIESFNEIISFLENVEDSESFEGIVSGITNSIKGIEVKLTELGSKANDLENKKATKAELQAEVTRAINAESTLSKSVEAETTRATNAENTLSNKITEESRKNKEAINEIEDFVMQSRYGYNATVNGLKGGIHSIETAIKDVPSKFRMLGQKITFRTEKGDWATYHNESLSLDNYENVNDWVQEVGISSVTGDINITNAPDYEDLTEAEEGKLMFADKEYSKESFSGLGRVYLRKNIVEGVNVLTQDMIAKPNTIYIIQYDYDLQGAEITIPEGCVLDFQGGNIRNGLLKGNIQNKSLVFQKDMSLSFFSLMKEGSIVYLNSDIDVNDICDISCCINGCGHTINITSPYSYLNIVSDNVDIYNVKLLNPNTNYDREARVIRSYNNDNLSIRNCFIGAGIRIENQSYETEHKGFEISDCDIMVDYSERKQDTYSQHDVFYIIGIKNVRIHHNRIHCKNVCRVLKTQDSAHTAEEVPGITDNSSENILFEFNYVESDCINGKQFWDMYNGSVNVVVRHNIIKCKGHTMIFEDKTNETFFRDMARRIDIYYNEIWYDTKLILTLNNVKGEQFNFHHNYVVNSSDQESRTFMENGVEVTTTRNPIISCTNTDYINIYNNEFINEYESFVRRIVNKAGTTKIFRFNNNYVLNYKGIEHLGDGENVICCGNRLINTGGELMYVSCSVEDTRHIDNLTIKDNYISKNYTLIENVERVSIGAANIDDNVGMEFYVVALSTPIDKLISKGVFKERVVKNIHCSAQSSYSVAGYFKHKFNSEYSFIVTNNSLCNVKVTPTNDSQEIIFQVFNPTDELQNIEVVVDCYSQKTI